MCLLQFLHPTLISPVSIRPTPTRNDTRSLKADAPGLYHMRPGRFVESLCRFDSSVFFAAMPPEGDSGCLHSECLEDADSQGRLRANALTCPAISLTSAS